MSSVLHTSLTAGEDPEGPEIAGVGIHVTKGGLVVDRVSDHLLLAAGRVQRGG